MIAIIGTMLAFLALKAWRLRRWFGPLDWRISRAGIFVAALGVVVLWGLGWPVWRALLVVLWGAWALAAVPQVAHALRARDAASASEQSGRPTSRGADGALLRG